MRTWIIAAIAVTSAAAAALSVGLAFPLGEAEATPRPEVEALLADLAPGATVSDEPDGSVSVTGVLTARAQAEDARANQLARTHPWIIQCSAVGTVSTCAPVADEDVPALVEADAQGLHYRVIYRTSIDPADAGAPLFDADELVCTGGSKLTCHPVTVAQPTLSRSETLFLTYRPANLRFNSDGGLVLRVEATPAVALRRTP